MSILQTTTTGQHCEATLEFQGASIHLTASSVDVLLDQLAKFGISAQPVASAPAAKPAAKKTELTATQQAAVDDTAGLEEVNKSAAKKSQPAPTARTEPTASAGADAAQDKPTTAESTTTPPADVSDAAPADDKPVAYSDLQKAVLELHKLDPSATLPIAKELGYENFKAMNPEGKEAAPGLFAKALGKVQAAIAAAKGV